MKEKGVNLIYNGINMGDVNILWANILMGPAFHVWNGGRNKPHMVQSVHGFWDFNSIWYWKY